MAYFDGENLDRKIKSYGLEDLEAVVQGFSEHQKWSSKVLIRIEPKYLEPLRIVVYSILHRYRVKDTFIVKIDRTIQAITVDLKKTGKVQEIGAVGGTPMPTAQVVMAPEELPDFGFLDED